jgi:hypothetical protein
MKSSGDHSSPPAAGLGSYCSPLPLGDRYRWRAPAIPPYTMILLAQEALDAERVEQAEYLIEAVYALYDCRSESVEVD